MACLGDVRHRLGVELVDLPRVESRERAQIDSGRRVAGLDRPRVDAGDASGARVMETARPCEPLRRLSRSPDRSPRSWLRAPSADCDRTTPRAPFERICATALLGRRGRYVSRFLL